MIKLSFILTIILTTAFVIVAITDKNAASFFANNLISEMTLAKEVQFKLRIDKFSFKKLDLLAQASLTNGFLKDESREWVPCSVNGTSCKIRLRGDLPKHWEGIKRSYRIKFKDPSPFWGWKKVDLILPDDKGFESEIVAYDLAKKLHLIAPGAHFSQVSINGVNTGTYLIKQGDSGSLFEMNGRTESMLIKENNIWWYAQNSGGIYKSLMQKDQWDNSNLRTLSLLYSPIFSGKAANDQTFSRFAQMLELASQDKDISRHLHQQYFYSWLAIAMTFGSIHSTLPDNLLWYVNGSTGLAEPIIYDVLPLKLYGNPFQFFMHKSFIVNKILKLTWNRGGKEDFAKALSTIEENIDSSYANYTNERKEAVYSNLKLIKTYSQVTSF